MSALLKSRPLPAGTAENIANASRAIGKLRERILSIPSEVALRLMCHPRVGRLGSGVSAREPADLALRAPLDSLGTAIVDGLDRDGVYTTSLASLVLPGNRRMLADAKVLSGTLAQRSQHPASKGRAILTASADDILARPSLYYWGLDDRVLDIVETYLGGTCAYDGLAYYYSRADGREVSTRKWHRDREDRRMVKVAVYINDVCEASGPLEVLDPGVQTRLDRELSWPYQTVTHDQMTRMLGAAGAADATKSITGGEGTVIFVDTARCHHRGKPPTARDRSAIFYSYFPSAPRHPFCCERSTLSRGHLRQLSQDLPQRQKACVQWRDRLPLTSRLIPRNRMTV